MMSRHSSVVFVIYVIHCRYFVQGLWNQSCVTGDVSCSVCCANSKCHNSSGFPFACKDGCIDGHRGVRCYELCNFKCKSCKSSINYCDSCYDGFFLGPKRTCEYSCPLNCKICSSDTHCQTCKEEFFKPENSFYCTNLPCPKNCKCNNNTCIKCKPGFYNIDNSCENKCPNNCINCSSDSDCHSCKDGFYSISGQSSCSKTCNNDCISCSSYDKCLKCQTGKFGHQCHRNCSNGCRDNTCFIETGQCECLNNFFGEMCSDCVFGKYGNSCDEKCSDNCKNNTCDRTEGTCYTGCKSDSMTGRLCKKCVVGTHGSNCEKHCPKNCLNLKCDKENGTCSDGCTNGFKGSFCLDCVKGRYGDECNEDCPNTCKDNECVQKSGSCFECVGNYDGQKCDTCIPGFYGSDCLLNCSSNCLNVSCYKDSGECYHECIDGYSGDKCCVNSNNCLYCSNNTHCRECTPGFFGQSCDKKCDVHCKDNVCEISTGICTEGCTIFSDNIICSRSQERPSDTTENSGNIIPIVSGAAGSVAFIALGTLIILCFLKQRRKKTHGDRKRHRPYSKKQENVYENFGENQFVEDNKEEESAINARVVSVDTEQVHFNTKSDGEARLDMRDHSDDIGQMYHNDESDDHDMADKYRVKVKNLFSYVSERQTDSFASEFEDLADNLDLTKHCTIAMRSENIALNRYNSMYPYDHSRVQIAELPKFFINACYIDGYNDKKRAYIASLGPTSNTTNKFCNFWLMVWHERSDVIVMLTNLNEVSGMKCEKYWPDTDKGKLYGQITVKCRSVEEFAEYTVRTFTISKGKEERNVIHLHFTAWPDKGVPKEVTSLVEFRQRVKAVPVTLGGPLIVHCSAGVGRTGTYIALDILTEEGNDLGSVDVFKCVNKMREQRVNMVQTSEQYTFLHKALVHSLSFDCETLSAEEIQAMMYQADDQKFTEIFQLLQREIDTECEEEINSREENRRHHNKKNRRHSEIPANRSRVRLFVTRSYSSDDYINAVFISSFKTKNLFIVAQSPLKATVEDFLCMVYQQDCACVVTLDQPLEQSNKDDQYLPADNKAFICGNFTVTSSKYETTQQFVVKKLTIAHAKQTEVKTVYHYQYKKWAKYNNVPDTVEDFIHFVKHVEKRLHQLTKSNPHVVVHCLSGYQRSGLFCTLYTLLEKLEAERQVSVVNIIRKIRAHRRQAITGVEQLKFCFRCISAYLEMYNTYTNYAS